MKMALLFIMIRRVKGMNRTAFGTVEGREAQLYSFANAGGMEMTVCDYGAHLVSVKVPAKDGSKKDVVLGYGDVSGYVTDPCHLGATIGRNGNRIANAAFELNGVRYQLAANENGNSLHSGPDGYEYRFWEVKEVKDQAITLHLDSPDKDQGFPGNFSVDVTYTLTDDNEVSIHYCGTCDADTVANMTNHSYFNLAGAGTILSHTAQITSGAVLEIGEGTIPTGNILAAEGTPFDFAQTHTIGERINAPELQATRGYDHCFVLDNKGKLKKFAVFADPVSGRSMTCATNQPGFQLYTGNFLDGAEGRNGETYGAYAGFCVETQQFPDAPNKPDFPSCILRPGETYDAITMFTFAW